MFGPISAKEAIHDEEREDYPGGMRGFIALFSKVDHLVSLVELAHDTTLW